MTGKTPMTPSDSARIQSSQAKGGHDMSSKGFAAHAQSAGQQNANSGLVQNAGSGNKGSSGGGEGSGSTSAPNTPKK